MPCILAATWVSIIGTHDYIPQCSHVFATRSAHPIVYYETGLHTSLLSLTNSEFYGTRVHCYYPVIISDTFHLVCLHSVKRGVVMYSNIPKTASSLAIQITIVTTQGLINQWARLWPP